MSIQAWSASLRALAEPFRRLASEPAIGCQLVVGRGTLPPSSGWPIYAIEPSLASVRYELPTDADMRVLAQSPTLEEACATLRASGREPKLNDQGRVVAIKIPLATYLLRMWDRLPDAFFPLTRTALTLLLNPPHELVAALPDVLPEPPNGVVLEAVGIVTPEEHATFRRGWASMGCRDDACYVTERGLIYARMTRGDKVDDKVDDPRGWFYLLHRLAWRSPVGLAYTATRYKRVGADRVTLDGEFHTTDLPPMDGSIDIGEWIEQRTARALADSWTYSTLGDDVPVDVSLASAHACEWLAAFADGLAVQHRPEPSPTEQKRAMLDQMIAELIEANPAIINVHAADQPSPTPAQPKAGKAKSLTRTEKLARAVEYLASNPGAEKTVVEEFAGFGKRYFSRKKGLTAWQAINVQATKLRRGFAKIDSRGRATGDVDAIDE